ncbi:MULTISPECIES: phasin family protein [Flammeovirga]|uniref:Polyhydroxyalkanoate synthesis regulator phasin n=1 Tax=Flammeovirga agarivorans TaxID=2726742 RepID=A0A7X8XV30_9BACT|nr:MULTISPECIES: hypothetical protein [Flammeovirga]NLR90829.1 hypothetical protein [Flammeovirga agarivorans]
MEELLKKIVYTGVGITAYTIEKVNEVVDKLIAEEKITEEEGKKIVDELVANTEAKKDEFESQVKTLVDKFTSSVNFDLDSIKSMFKGGDSEEVEILKARIEALEAQAAKAPSKEEEKPASSEASEA